MQGNATFASIRTQGNPQCNPASASTRTYMYSIYSPRNTPNATLVLPALTSPVSRWMISKQCFTILTAINFFPLLRPCIWSEFTKRSTIGHYNVMTVIQITICNSIKDGPQTEVQNNFHEQITPYPHCFHGITMDGHVQDVYMQGLKYRDYNYTRVLPRRR